MQNQIADMRQELKQSDKKRDAAIEDERRVLETAINKYKEEAESSINNSNDDNTNNII